MTVIATGAHAPPILGVDVADGTTALFFYKVTCPVCQMTGPVAKQLEDSFPGTVTGIGQDPEEKLDAFSGEYDWSFASEPDLPPYPVSEAYGIRVVPTVVLVHDGTVVDLIESWDRDGYNRVSSRLAELTGLPATTMSQEGDGLPSFRPG
jgi:hypothetical protein